MTRRTCSLPLLALIAAALGGAAIPAAAQSPTPADSVWELRTGDGTTHIGRVLSRDDERIVFQTISGSEVVASARFSRLRPAPGRVVEGEYWAADRNTTRLGWMALFGGADDSVPYFPIVSFSYSWGM